MNAKGQTWNKKRMNSDKAPWKDLFNNFNKWSRWWHKYTCSTM